MGSWFDHIPEYLEARSTLNIHYVQYEDMLKVGYLPFPGVCYVCSEKTFVSMTTKSIPPDDWKLQEDFSKYNYYCY